ncbi:hypothetical protein SDC9_130528 [bioreactor metagenome]|uniref:Uncharacterized protein n=1 Tax=bioreactor metagenome TaxID=1076179 RepID=A0A645D2E8_9ZZZZ
MQRRRIGHDGRLETQALAFGHDRHPVIAQRSGNQDDIPRPGATA